MSAVDNSEKDALVYIVYEGRQMAMGHSSWRTRADAVQAGGRPASMQEQELVRLGEVLASGPLDIGIDIGGSLVKIACCMNWEERRFEYFVVPVEHLMMVIAELNASHHHQRISVTGGGAVKYKSILIAGINGLDYGPVDEMVATSRGVLRINPELTASGQEIIIVNVGSGVSVLKVNSLGHIQRVAGSCIGGATFMGLMRVLTRTNLTFEEAMSLCAKGDNIKCDQLVRDIYGDGVHGICELPKDLIAASLGKVSFDSRIEDMAASALLMIIISIAQLAVYSMKTETSSTLYFSGGFFAAEHVWRLMEEALMHWNMKGKLSQNPAFVGAVGALNDSRGNVNL